MSALHSEMVERSFSQQAPAFGNRPSNRFMTTGLDWVFERLELRSDDLLLDVAAGTGHAARLMAPSVAGVIALDATEAMLASGRAEAEQAGIENIDFLQGDAARLPFEQDSFDVVVCRFSIHHFDQPEMQMKEMIRCLRPGGRLAIADLVADSDPAIAAAQNQLEWLRDPAHARMLSAEQLAGWLEVASMEQIDVEVRSARRPLDPWLAQTETSEGVGEAVRAKLRAELDGAPQTGFRPREDGDGLSFVQTFASVLALKPS